MAPLSQPVPMPRPPRKRVAAAPPPLAIVGASVETILAGVRVKALPAGALWIEEARALLVSDLHLEKGSSYALSGQMLPPYDTQAALQRLAALIREHTPDIVISLGDSFHDYGGSSRMDGQDRALLETLIGAADWVWVEGNHDGRSAETLGGAWRSELQISALKFRHVPSGEPGEIAGHLHPCARVAGRGRSVRRRCFATDGVRLVMPAFGAYAGGLNVRDEAFASIFPDGAIALVIGRDRVLPAPQERLLED